MHLWDERKDIKGGWEGVRACGHLSGSLLPNPVSTRLFAETVHQAYNT